MTGSKACFRCKETKPLDGFYKHPAMGDGYLGKCKVCTKSDATAHRNANLEKIRQYDRDRGKIPERSKAAAQISSAWRREDKRRTKCHNARMIPRPYNPVSRYGVSKMPDDSVPVEIVRDSGAVQYAEWRAGMWFEGKRPVNAIENRVAFWRYVE